MHMCVLCLLWVKCTDSTILKLPHDRIGVGRGLFVCNGLQFYFLLPSYPMTPFTILCCEGKCEYRTIFLLRRSRRSNRMPQILNFPAQISSRPFLGFPPANCKGPTKFLQENNARRHRTKATVRVWAENHMRALVGSGCDSSVLGSRCPAW